jgi:hypothetical protein
MASADLLQTKGLGAGVVVEFSRPAARLVERKGAMYPLSVNPVDGLRESDNEPNCALSDCRFGLESLGLYEPL